MSSASPLLSICIANYNHAHYLPRAIDAILSQSFQDYELLILDDGSTDHSKECLKQYAKKDPRIRIFLKEDNKGVAIRTNELIAESRGLYLHTHGADDYRLPGCLEALMAPLLENPDIEIACGQFFCEENGQRTLETCGISSKEERLYFSPKQMPAMFRDAQFKMFSIALISKKNLYIKYGGYRKEFSYFDDWFVLHQMVFNHKMVFITKPLSVFSIHNHNYSNTHRRNKVTRRAAYKAILKALDEPQHLSFRSHIRNTGLIWFIFQEFFWSMLLNPRYWSFWPAIQRKYPIQDKLKKSWRKKLMKLGWIKNQKEKTSQT
ncbi:MAG: glycosyltransferase [Verrucomicrobia bacterium]|nr:glycosyltransferase [Verrucomicrobiota bacterium]MBS0646676.1 glycosyltransferase [Verrucomicrobiota bacterium]